MTDRDLPYEFLPRVAPEALIVVCLPAPKPGRIHYSPLLAPRDVMYPPLSLYCRPLTPPFLLCHRIKGIRYTTGAPLGFVPTLQKKGHSGTFYMPSCDEKIGGETRSLLNICLLISGWKISVEIFGESLDTPKNAACFDLGITVHPSSPLLLRQPRPN